MEGLLILLGLVVVGIPLVGGIVGIIAAVSLSRVRRDLDRRTVELFDVLRRVDALEKSLKDFAARQASGEPAPRAQAPPAAAPAAPVRTPPPPPAPRPAAAPAPQPAAPAGDRAAPAGPPGAPAKVEAWVTAHVSPEAARAAQPSPRKPSAPEEPPARPPAAALEAFSSWAEFEKRVGMRWIAWAGAVALFLAAAFFVKYAFDNKWIGNTAKVSLGIAFGIVLLILGDVSIRRKMAPLGQALMGAGLAALYASLFGAYARYKIMPQEVSFASMILVTAAGMTLAVLHNAPVISVLAMIGGFLTPVLLSTGVDARDALFTYLLLLDVAVLGVAIFRKWRPLEILAFLGTFVLYAGWYNKFYRDAAAFPALYWLGAFYAVFLVMPFVYHLRARSAVAIDHFILALVNAAFAIRFAYLILYPARQETLGFLALAASAVYLLFGLVVRKRIPADATSLFGFIALSVMLLTLAIPLELGLNGILLAWAAEGPALLYLGYRFKYQPVRIGGAIILVLAFARLVTRNWPSHDALFVLFWNVKFGAAIAVPAAAAVFAAIHHIWKKAETPLDMPIKIIAAIAGGLLATILVDRELASWLAYSANTALASRDYLPHCATVLVWAAGSALFLAGGVFWRCRSAVVIGLLALLVPLESSFELYQDKMVKEYYLFINARFISCLIAALVVFVFGRYIRKFAETMWKGDADFGLYVYYVAGLLLLAVLGIEPYTYCTWTIGNVADARWMANMSLSIVWSAFALGALLVGFTARSLATRMAAFAVLILAMLRLLVHNWPSHEMLFTPLWNLKFAMAMIIPLAAALIAVVHQSRAKDAAVIDRLAKVAAAILAGLFAAFLVNIDLFSWLQFRADAAKASREYLPYSVTVAVWAACAAALLAAGVRAKSRAAVAVGIAALLVPVACFAILYSRPMIEGFLPFANVRFAVFLAACLELFLFAYFIDRMAKTVRAAEGELGKAVYWLAGLFLLVLLSTEPYQYSVWTVAEAKKAQWAAQMSLTVVWSVYAVVALAIGFWKRSRALRFAALALFVIAAAKVLIVDMRNVRQIYRIISLFGIGTLMMVAAYLYHRVAKRVSDFFGEAK